MSVKIGMRGFRPIQEGRIRWGRGALEGLRGTIIAMSFYPA